MCVCFHRAPWCCCQRAGLRQCPTPLTLPPTATKWPNLPQGRPSPTSRSSLYACEVLTLLLRSVGLDGVDFDLENLGVGCVYNSMSASSVVNWMVTATNAAKGWYPLFRSPLFSAGLSHAAVCCSLPPSGWRCVCDSRASGPLLWQNRGCHLLGGRHRVCESVEMRSVHGF